VDFATLDQRNQRLTRRFDELDLHLGMAFGITAEERGKDAFDGLRRRRDAQDAGVAYPQLARVFAERSYIAQDRAAVGEQLLAFAGQHHTPAQALEELEAELILEGADLSGQRGLS